MKKNNLVAIASIIVLLCAMNNVIAQKVKPKDLEKVITKRLKLDNQDFKKVENLIPLGIGNDTIIYIANLKMGGFLILSSDLKAAPVLGISYKGNIKSDSINEGLNFVINKFIYGLDSLIKNNIEPDEETRDLWNKYLNNNKSATISSKSSVSNLLDRPYGKVEWGQGSAHLQSDDGVPPYQETNYNRLCPTRCKAGCVAVAMAQILWYWRWNVNQMGSNSYDGQYANFGNSFYCWDQMDPNSPDNYNSKLIYHAGISCNTDYCKRNYESASDNVKALVAFENYWGFSSAANSVNRKIVMLPTWKNRLKDELDAGRPILYVGGEHCWVISGYNDDNAFYCNWGVSGIYDGYYKLGEFNPGGQNYNNYEAAIFDLFPETEVLAELSGPDELTSTSANYYIENIADCKGARFTPGPGIQFVYGGNHYISAKAIGPTGWSWIDVTYILDGEYHNLRKSIHIQQ